MSTDFLVPPLLESYVVRAGGIEPDRWTEMALMSYLSFCVLGCDFMILIVFKWIYGEKPRRRSRRPAIRTGSGKGQTPQHIPYPEARRLPSPSVSRQ